MATKSITLASAFFLLAIASTTSTALAGQRQFKVLEIDENQTGPYAMFSGGSIDKVAVGREVCVRGATGGGKKIEKPIFCAKVVSVRKRAAAFYIPEEHREAVEVGAIVTIDFPDEDTEPEAKPSRPSGPLFPPGSYTDLGFHLQATPAIKSSSISFQPLPRDNTNEPWRERDALNVAPLGLQVAWAHAFLSKSTFLGLRGLYARSMSGDYQNDYDLSDSQSWVETSTQASTLGLSIFYGLENKLTDDIGFRASAGAGYRRTTATVTSKSKGASDATLVDGSVTGSAPVIELASGATYQAAGLNWLAQIMVGIPTGVKTSTAGTFNSVQEVPEDDVKANILENVGPAKGMEISLAFGVSLVH
jgi:hypothetical protein